MASAAASDATTFGVLGHIVDAPRLGTVRGLDGTPALIVVSTVTGAITALHRTNAAEEAARLEASGVMVRKLAPREYLLPGFIDTHVHLAQWPYMGTGIDKPLMASDGFLAKYAFPTESSLNAETANSVYAGALDDLLRHGTTTALIFGSARLDASDKLIAAAVRRGGPRALVGKVAMDRHCPEGYVEETAQSLADTEAFIERTKAANLAACGADAARDGPPLVAPVVTPRFLPTCTPDLLTGLGALAEKHNVLIQSHMSESCDELAFSNALYPDYASDADAFAAYGLLRAPCVMAHCVHLQPGETERLMLHGAAIAHCPLSNFFFAKEALPVRRCALLSPCSVTTIIISLAHGNARAHDHALKRGRPRTHACPHAHTRTQVRQLKEMGVLIGLGTDVAGGYAPSMLDAMRHAVLASKTLQFKRANGCVFGCGVPAAAAGGAGGGGGAGGSGARTASERASAPKRARTAGGRRSVPVDGTLRASFDPGADEAALRARHDISHLDALHLATQSGADALGLGEQLGSFDVGKRFDALVLAATPPSIRPYPAGVAEDASDVLHKLLTLGDDRHVVAVYVGGAQLVGLGGAPP